MNTVYPHMNVSGSKNVNDSQTQPISGDNTPTLGDGTPARLCYVDDSRTSAYVVKRLLRPYGYIVDHFDSAEPALSALVQANYDLLLTDLKVSSKGMDGDDLVRALRNTGNKNISTMPIIVITGATDKSTLTEVYEAGANQIMNKPVSGDELDEEIRKLIFARKQKSILDRQDHIKAPTLNAKQTKQSESDLPGKPRMQQPGMQQQKGAQQKTTNQIAKKGGTVIPFGAENKSIRPTSVESVHTAKSPLTSKNEIDDIPTLDGLSNKPSKPNIESNNSERRVIKPGYTLSGSVRPQPTSDVKPACRVTPKIKQGARGAVNNKGKVLNPVVTGSPAQAANSALLKKPTTANGSSSTETSSNNVSQHDSQQATAKAALIAKKKIELAKKIRQAKIKKARLEEAARIEKLTLEPLDNQAEKPIEPNSATTAEPASNGHTDKAIENLIEKPVEKPSVVKEKAEHVEKLAAPQVVVESTPAVTSPPILDIDKNTNILQEMEKYPLTEVDLGSNYGSPRIVSMLGSVFELFGLKRLISSAILLVGVYYAYMMLQDYFYQGVEVEVAVVEQGEIFQSITYPGQVVSKMKVNISPAISGRLTKVYVDEGDTVKSHDLLARLDDREAKSYLSRAKANLVSAKEDVIMAKRNLKRLKQAYSKGAVAKQLVEDAEVDLRSAKAKRTISQEEVLSAKLTLENPKIVAPFSGTITTKHAEVGQWVVPSETLFTLIDGKQREIEVHVDVADSGGIAVGQTVGLSSDAFPGLKWSESVTRLAAATSNVGNANTVSVFISLGSNAPTLRFGQQVDADIRTAWNPNAIKVPYATVSNRKGSSWVATIENGRVNYVEVITGIEDFSNIEILQGVNIGQSVVLTSGLDLEQGDKVKLATSNSL